MCVDHKFLRAYSLFSIYIIYLSIVQFNNRMKFYKMFLNTDEHRLLRLIASIDCNMKSQCLFSGGIITIEDELGKKLQTF